ncbi:MAG: GTPase Era [Thermodesulfovibrionales bacterium]
MKGFHSGYVAIVGRPNVGKSTLLNNILGQKVSIVTSRPQTTRKRITGIKTLKDCQIIFIDTPGIHKPIHKLGEFMVQEAIEALKDVDLILFMVEPREPGGGERFILDLIKKTDKRCILIINKVDLIKKAELLPLIENYSRLHGFDAIIPISAINKEDVLIVLKEITKRLPEGPKYYPDDVITDQYQRFIASEIIREKIMERTEEEVPHAVAVEITKWQEEENRIFISANIFVEREGQKGIIIGKGGKRLKEIGKDARLEIESLTEKRVFLELWVKVKEKWRSNERLLKELYGI